LAFFLGRLTSSYDSLFCNESIKTWRSETLYFVQFSFLVFAVSVSSRDGSYVVTTHTHLTMSDSQAISCTFPSKYILFYFQVREVCEKVLLYIKGLQFHEKRQI
jgi:hypothetical protein